MPPSPALRISPGRELRAENHKRGRSLESGILFQDKDEDLALFNEVQNKERESFLLQSNDGLDDIFSTKLRHFTDYKIGMSIPARGESSDLLNAEGDRNDYDWLITPPETPLFRSLDDEAPPVSLAHRGRPRSQPVTISRSSMMEKGYRSSRDSASPHHLSPSPQSCNSMLQSRSRPFSATHSSPPPTLRHASSSRRLSPPPSKPTPAPSSGTPTPRRMNTGSAGATAPSTVRGASPIKTSRGNSASPKIRAWQSNIPGFSTEAPPNLRTSLADRPASYVRGSSPASRNGSRSGRQSMSPTASRSVSSSHSHDRDKCNSYSKGSAASSGDDDMDLLQSNLVSSSGRSVPRSTGTSPNNRATGFSKKPTKILSTPRRSFDLAVRQMERKGSQNMFRPLLSSVPSSTFYVGKSSAHHRALASRNSSITTSSNASSEQGASGALDNEESEQNQEDLSVTSDFVKGQYIIVNDFSMDQADVSNEAVENRIFDELSGCQDGENDDLSVVISHLGVAKSCSQLDTATTMYSADVVLARKYEHSNADVTAELKLCSRCSHKFHSIELLREGDLRFCLECKSLEVNSTTIVPAKTLMIDRDAAGNFVNDLECGSLEVLDQSFLIPESSQATCAGEIGMDHLDTIDNEAQQLYSEPKRDLAVSLIEKRDLTLSTQQEIFQSVDGEIGNPESQQAVICSNSKVDASEGTGISLLLQTSSNGKGHIFRSRSFTASNICYNDFSNMRDSRNSLRSSTGHSTAFISSSVDLGSSMQLETRIQRQSSGRKHDMENYRYETLTKHKCSSSLSGTSGHVSQVPSMTPSCLGDSREVISIDNDKEAIGVICADPLEHTWASEHTEAESTCAEVENTIIFKTAAEQLSGHLMNVHSGDTPVASLQTSEEPLTHESGENLRKSSNSMNEETSAVHLRTYPQGEDAMEIAFADRVDIVEIPQPSSLDNVSEKEFQNANVVSADSQPDGDSTNSDTYTDALLEPCISEAQNDVVTTAVEEFDISVPVNCVLEESTVVLDDLGGGTKSRSFTLEEATDTILFCSSIVHNLAYEAANIAIDKESSSVDALRPTVTFVVKTNSTRRDVHLRTLRRRSSKSQKAHQRKMEMDTKPPPAITETNEKSTPCIVRSPSKGDSILPPKLESKCNCTIM